MIATLSHPLVYPTLNESYNDSSLTTEQNIHVGTVVESHQDKFERTSQAIKSDKPSECYEASPCVKKVSFEDSPMEYTSSVKCDSQLQLDYVKEAQKPQCHLIQDIPDNHMTDTLPLMDSSGHINQSLSSSDSHLSRLRSFIKPSSSVQSKSSSSSDSMLQSILYRSSFYHSSDPASVIVHN